MAYRGKSDSRLLLINIGGQTVGVYYRSPTASEYISYHEEKIQLKGRRIEHNLPETNIKYGLKVITGIQKGDLEYKKDGEWVPLDTDAMPEAEWRVILRRDFFEIVDFVGAKVFNPVEETASEEDGYDEKNS